MVLAIDARFLMVAFVAALQFVATGLILSRRGGEAVRLVSGLLFALNGLVSVALAWQLTGLAPVTAARVLVLVDAPTGWLAIVLAACFVSTPKVRSIRSQPWLVASLAGVTICAIGATIVAATTPAGASGLFWLWYATIPLFVGYGLLLPAVAWRFLQHPDRDRESAPALLLVGFGARPVEFASFYGLPVVAGQWDFSSVVGGLQGAAKLFLLLGASATLALILYRMATTPRASRRYAGLALIALAAAAALGLVPRGGGSAAGEYLVSIFTLVVVRPLLVCWALEPARTTRAFVGLCLATGTFLTAKALIAVAFGTPFFELSSRDALALVAIAVLLPLATLQRRSASAPSRSDTGIDPLTQAERVIRALLDGDGGGAPGQGLLTAELCERAAVPPRSIAREIRRAEASLAAAAGPACSRPLIRVDLVGIRSHKVYRLSPDGARVAKDLISARGAS